MLGMMSWNRRLRIGQPLLKIGGVTAGLVFALLDIFRELFAAVDVEHNDDRQLLDTDLIGEFNHRTGRLDAGNDPYGWYGDD